MIPINQRTRMINKAAKRHPDLSPCGDKQYLTDCFTIINRSRGSPYVCLWYNTPDGSTHTLMEPKEAE